MTNKEIRDEIAKRNADIMGSNTDPFYGAPVILIVLGKKDWPTHVYDGSLVIGNLMLAAHDLGIGSCWIHRAKEEFESDWGKKLLKSLGIEDEYEGIGHCALGYVDGDYPDVIPRKRIAYLHIGDIHHEFFICSTWGRRRCNGQICHQPYTFKN